MATRKIIKLPNASGGATGLQEVVAEVGWEYFKLFGIQKSGAAVIGDITNIMPMINNKGIWENIDGIDLDAIRAYDSLVPFATNTILMIDFERQHFIDGVPRQATSINTLIPSKATHKAITNFGLKYTLGVAATFDWYAEVLPSDPVGPGYIPRLEKTADTLSIGTKTFNGLPYGAKDVLHAQWQRVFMKNATITQVELKNGSDSVIEQVPTAAINQLLTDGGKIPGAYFGYILDFARYQMPEYFDVLGIAEKNLKLMITSSAATAVEIIVESLGEIE